MRRLPAIMQYHSAGQWIDYFTGGIHIGLRVVEREAPPDEIPVYKRV
ncbi:hypothetical protein [Allorhizocola rhizosphaerae]|nr:hypothetical protein [Allorhizocola rhizosphaerae]